MQTIISLPPLTLYQKPLKYVGEWKLNQWMPPDFEVKDQIPHTHDTSTVLLLKREPHTSMLMCYVDSIYAMYRLKIGFEVYLNIWPENCDHSFIAIWM